MHAEHRPQLHRPNTSTQEFQCSATAQQHCCPAAGSLSQVPYHHQQHPHERAGKSRLPSHCAQAAVGHRNSGTGTQVSLTANTQGCGGVDAHSPLPKPNMFLPPTQTCIFLPTLTKSQPNPTTNQPTTTAAVDWHQTMDRLLPLLCCSVKMPTVAHCVQQSHLTDLPLAIINGSQADAAGPSTPIQITQGM